MSSFAKLGLTEPLCRALEESGYTTPTPIQEQAIPHLLEGRDLLGCAKTGTGKTAAFALPILQRLSAAPRASARPSGERRGDRARGHSGPSGPAVRALVLVPTRELAAQVAESFRRYGKRLSLSVALVHGGVGQGPQAGALARGADVLVATPGRLIDLMGQGIARLGEVEALVLDEADHMLDLGFLPAVRRIVGALPKRRQNLLFSATMPGPIAKLADSLLSEPVKVSVTPPATTVEALEQRVHHVAQDAKLDLLAHLLEDPAVERALVFTRTKRGADRVAKRLVQCGIEAEAIHGNKSQNARKRTLDGFKGMRVRVLVATDLAARGIDVDGITHVVNFELPDVPESYVHRIGRTARAGASGIAISFCSPEERGNLRDIERAIRRSVPVGPRDQAAEERSKATRPRAAAADEARPGARRGASTRRAGSASGGHARSARAQARSAGAGRSRTASGARASGASAQRGAQNALRRGEEQRRTERPAREFGHGLAHEPQRPHASGTRSEPGPRKEGARGPATRGAGQAKPKTGAARGRTRRPLAAGQGARRGR